MLGKLLKYELRATARLFIPFYLAAIVLSLLNRMLFVVLVNVEFLAIPRVLVMATYVFIIIATFVMTYLVVIQRFYKNLLDNEGYLSMTLPVKTSSHILSKSISAAIWILSTTIVTFISIFTMLPNYEFLPKAVEFWKVVSAEFARVTSLNLNLVTFLLFVAAFISVITSILMIYTAISFGHLSNKHRVLTSFGAYVALYAIVQAISSIALIVVGYIAKDTFPSFRVDMDTVEELSELTSNFSTLPQFILGLAFFLIVLNLILCTAYFFITKYLLDKKLNLE